MHSHYIARREVEKETEPKKGKGKAIGSEVAPTKEKKRRQDTEAEPQVQKRKAAKQPVEEPEVSEPKKTKKRKGDAVEAESGTKSKPVGTSTVWDTCPERRKQWAKKWLGRLQDEFRTIVEVPVKEEMEADKEQGDAHGEEAEEEEQAEEDEEVEAEEEEEVEEDPKPKRKKMVATVSGGPVVRMRTKTSVESFETTPEKGVSSATSPSPASSNKSGHRPLGTHGMAFRVGVSRPKRSWSTVSNGASPETKVRVFQYRL